MAFAKTCTLAFTFQRKTLKTAREFKIFVFFLIDSFFAFKPD